MPGGPWCPAAIRADRAGRPHAAQPTSPGRLASEREFISGHSTSGLDFNTLKTSRTQLADGICRPHLCARHLILAVLTSAILGRQLEEGGVGRPGYQGWAGGGAPTLVDVFSVQTWSTQLLTGGRKLLWGWRDREKYGQRGRSWMQRACHVSLQSIAVAGPPHSCCCAVTWGATVGAPPMSW